MSQKFGLWIFFMRKTKSRLVQSGDQPSSHEDCTPLKTETSFPGRDYQKHSVDFFEVHSKGLQHQGRVSEEMQEMLEIGSGSVSEEFRTPVHDWRFRARF